MGSNKIDILLEKYYSGEISPNDYKLLLSELEKDGDSTFDMESERKMLFDIESCYPVMPHDFEKRLEKAIDRHRQKPKRIISIFISSAAAIALLCIVNYHTIIHPHPKRFTEAMAAEKITAAKQETMYSYFNETTLDEPIITTKPISESKESAYPDTDDENLEEAAKKVNEALQNVLSGIQMSQNNVAECIESITISQ